MKLKPTVLLATFVVTLGLLLGTSAAQETTVIFEDDTSKAIGITNLEIEGTLYNVAFTSTETVASMVYGDFPGKFVIQGLDPATDAMRAVSSELTTAGATAVGAAGLAGVPFFWVGYESEQVSCYPCIEVVFYKYAVYVKESDGEPLERWFPQLNEGTALYNWGTGVWAKFTEAVETPGKATLISPSGTITDNTPTYTWNALADSTWYRLFVWDSTKTEIIDQWYTADEAGCSDGTGECSVTPETVLADDSHEWWIRTWNDNGDGPWSDKLSFTVDTSVPPGKATLIAPSGDISDNTPTYTWNAVADSTWYRLFVWDSTETEIIDQWYTAEEVGCVDGTGECSVTPETVLADDLHEWWIRTWNKSGGDGDWSDKMSFTVNTDI